MLFIYLLSDLTEPLKEIACKCGVEVSDTFAIECFNSTLNDEAQSTLIVRDNKLIFGVAGSPFFYRGVG